MENDTGIIMEKHAIRKLWLHDSSGVHLIERDCGNIDFLQLDQEDVTPEREEYEAAVHGYFSVFFPDSSPKEESNDDEDTEDDKDSQKPFLFSELKRLSQKWMQPLMLNIDGWKKYNKGEREEALKLFKQAAEVDSKNTNGLKHCRYVYRKLQRDSEAEGMERQIQDILSREDAHVIKAHSEAELGMAFKALYGLAKIGRIAERLCNAINVAGDELPPAEVEYWRMNLAEAFHWWNLYRATHGVPGITEMQEKSVELYCKIASSNNADDLTRAQVLSHLGNFLSRKRDGPLSQILQNVIRRTHVLGGSMNARDYFAEAYSLDPNSAIISIEHGTYLMRSRMLEEAKRVIDRAFSVMDPAINYYHAYAMRAELCIKLYNQGEQKQHLELAIKDLTYFTQHESLSYGYGLLASAHRLLVLHDHPIYLDREQMAPALDAYEASIALLKYRRNSLSHFHHAECLADFGYLRRAIESSKRAVEHNGNALCMLNLMKQLLQLYEDEKKPHHIMGECVFWINVISQKLPPHALQRLLRELYEIHRPLMVRLYHNLLHNKHEHSAKSFRELIPNFRPWCPHPAQGYVPPPIPAYPCNTQNKPYDFVVLHSEEDKPWLYCSFLTKFELKFKLKGCVIGRDIEGSSITEDVISTLVTTLVPEKPAAELENVPVATAQTSHMEQNTEPNLDNTPPEALQMRDGHEMKQGTGSLQEPSSVQPQNKQDSTTEKTTRSKDNQHYQFIQKKDKDAMPPDTTEMEDLSGFNRYPIKLQKAQQSRAKSACVIIILTHEFLTTSVWFKDGQPSPKLEEILDAHRPTRVTILRWDDKLRCDQLFPDRSLKVFDCSDMVPWDMIMLNIQGYFGYVRTKVLTSGKKIEIADPM